MPTPFYIYFIVEGSIMKLKIKKIFFFIYVELFGHTLHLQPYTFQIYIKTNKKKIDYII